MENEAAADGEGIVATEMAPVMKAVKGFQPSRSLFAKIAQAAEIVRKHGADRTGQKEGKRDTGKGRRAQKNQKDNQSQDLIGDGHG